MSSSVPKVLDFMLTIYSSLDNTDSTAITPYCNDTTLQSPYRSSVRKYDSSLGISQ